MFSRRRSAHSHGSPTIIAKGVRLFGNLASEGYIDFCGVMEGNLESEHIILRSGGVVQGDVVCETADIYGTVQGAIQAKQVRLFSESRVEGSVYYESLFIEDGAFINGQCKRVDLAAQLGQQENLALMDEHNVTLLEEYTTEARRIVGG